jgi:hypothetical protein
VLSEIEARWHNSIRRIGVTRIGQDSAWHSQLIEKWMNHCLDSGETLGWGVFKEPGNEIDRVRVCFPEHLHKYNLVSRLAFSTISKLPY